MANKVVISEALNELSKGIKVKPLKESYSQFLDKNEIAQFIDDSVETVKNSPETTCRYILDKDLCLYVGIEGGFEDGGEICAKIGKRNDFDWAGGLEWIDQPVFCGKKHKIPGYPDLQKVMPEIDWGEREVVTHPEGEVWDTCVACPSGKDANWFIEQYEKIREALDDGEIMLESKKKSNKKAIKESYEFASRKYQNLIDDLANRVENLDDDIQEAIMDAMDDGLIYSEDLWTAIYEFASPGEVINALTERGTDIYTYIYEDIYECLQDKGLITESKRTTRRKSLREEDFSNKTSQGWTIVKKFKDLDDGRTHVIASRGSGEYPFAVGLGYNEKTGSWGQGMYDYKTAEEAENALKHNNRYHPYNVELIEEMSPEDKADSEVLRNVYNKVSKRTDAKVTDKEQKVLDKLGVSIQRKTPNDAYHRKDGDILDKSGGSLSNGVTKTVHNNTSSRIDWVGHPEISDEVNLADRARKRPERLEKRVSLGSNSSTPGHDSEHIHGEIPPEESKRIKWVGTDKVPTRDTKRHPYLTKERQSQASRMYKPMADMQTALDARKSHQDALDNVDKQYAKDVSYANDRFQRDMRNAETTRTRNRQAGEKGLADANDKINTLLKRK